MLPRGQAWQDCISLCVSIRLRELRGISALARLGYLLGRACTEAVAPCDGERIIKGDSILHLDLLLPHFSHLPKWHQLFCPIRRSQDNFSIAYNKPASPRYVCFCSWQNNTSIRPYYRVHLMACHRSPVIWSSRPAQASWDPECAGVCCRNSWSESGGLGFFCLFGWLFRWGFYLFWLLDFGQLVLCHSCQFINYYKLLIKNLFLMAKL